jgi:hypothetical protein
MKGNKKTPLVRGSLLKVLLAGVISTAPSSWSGQTLQLVSDIDTHLHSLAYRSYL